ncbi:MAG: hypothetical protein Q9221_003078 [Calogaya cf. arnoldii]
MDPLSITASVATVIDATTRIVSYIVNVNDAPKDLSALRTELQSLRNELEDYVTLSNQYNDNNDPGSSSLPILQRLTDLNGDSSPLVCCQQELETLVKELEKTGGSKGWKGRVTIRRLAWPFKESANYKSLQKIKNLRDAIASGLTRDTAVLAKDTNARIRGVDQQAQSIQDTLSNYQIFGWLSAPDMASNHYQASKKRAAATGRWLIDSPDYIEWKAQPQSLYWLHGLLGCGKTTLASTIIDDISKQCQATQLALAYFYFIKGADSQDCSMMLRTLIHQLTTRNPSCLKILTESYRTHGQGSDHLSLHTLQPTANSLTLNEIYAQILGNIDVAYRDLAIKAFQWVIHSKESISLDAMVDILAIDYTVKPWFDSNRRLIEKEDVLQICSNLVEFYSSNRRKGGFFDDLRLFSRGPDWRPKETRFVRLAHLSVREYLTSGQTLAASIADFAPQAQNAHANIARDCLSYLLHMNDRQDTHARALCDRRTQLGCTLNSLPEEEWQPLAEEFEMDVLASFPLLSYATQYWTHHARLAGEKPEQLFQVMVEAFEPYNFETWFGFDSPRCDRTSSARLAYAIEHRLPRLVQYLLKQNDGLSLPPPHTRTPLEAAARLGDLKLVKLLLEHGAKVDVSVNRHKSALWYAAEGGFVQIVELLIAQGAAIDRQEDSTETILMAAARENHLCIARTLIAKGANVNTAIERKGTALELASRRGHLDMVQLLLSAGTSTSLETNKPALSAAIRVGHQEVVRLLLDAGFHVNGAIPPDSEDFHMGLLYSHQTPLQCAAYTGQVSILRLLIDRGADIYLRPDDFEIWFPPLQLASNYGKLEVVELLLALGADVNERGGLHGSALQAACVSNAPSIINLLLRHGASLNEGGQSGSPLHRAAHNGRCKAIQTLIEHGADMNQKVGQGNTALEAALEKGHTRAAHLLLRAGADQNVKHELQERLQDTQRKIELESQDSQQYSEQDIYHKFDDDYHFYRSLVKKSSVNSSST